MGGGPPTRMRHELAVDCITCFAQPGDPCYDERGEEYVPPHAERRYELDRLVRQAERLYDDQAGSA